MLDVIEYFIEYFDMYYYLFVPWDFHNTAWVILGLIWYLNKLNTKYVRKNYNAILDALEKEKSNNTLKGDLIKSVFATSTMGVSYKVKLGKSI